MRRITVDEIYNISGNPIDKIVDFLPHVPEKYRVLMDAINHVDTRLKNNGKEVYWRVQGYIEISDFKYVTGLRKQFDAYIEIEEDALCIWSMSVPYKD